jgi:hypothetical protein
VSVLPNLLHLIQNPPDNLRRIALDRGALARCAQITENLIGLIGLIDGGRLGDMFARHASQPQCRDRPVVYDVSGLQQGEGDAKTAALLACWRAGRWGPAPSTSGTRFSAAQDDVATSRGAR